MKDVAPATKPTADTIATDPNRPVYHFASPANWMNDPNGTIFHQGWYHVFYQHNPDSDKWDNIHWGHARSRDLVNWEHLPIALRPSTEKGEKHCFSGCAWVTSTGNPLLLYTSIGNKKSRNPEQWLATGSKDWTRWHKSKRNPILTLDIHNGLDIREWRDPFLFRSGGRTLLLIGGKLGPRSGTSPVCLIYEAHDPQLTVWTFQGIFYTHKKARYPNFECPNFAKIGDKWVLISTHGSHPVEYAVGDFNPHMLVFEPEKHGIINHNGKTSHFAATNLIRTPEGQCVMVGWVKGFKNNQSWNGCLSLPRVLDINALGELTQTPWPGLTTLREHREEVCGQLQDTTFLLPKTRGHTLEIVGEIRLKSNHHCQLRLACTADQTGGITIDIEPDVVRVDKIEAPLARRHLSSPIPIHIFLDHAVIELFIDSGRRCITRVIYPEATGEHLAVSGTAYLDLTVWTLSETGEAPDPQEDL